MQTPEPTSTTAYAGRHRFEDHAAPSLPGYDVIEPIGRGGSGSLWSATGPGGATVAIKVVRAVDAEDALVELAVLGRIRDPHLIRMHEAVALPGGDVALVLDHVAGGTVGSVVRARGHLAPGELVTVLTPVASTVARLHGAGVVHGDLSPDNVLLDLDGRPFVADLGVARITGTRVEDLRGTDGFVAPEVLAGGLPTPASDVHALGALAWFCLTGEAPGPAVVRGRLADRVAGLPSAVVAAVERAMRSRPEERPDADALAVAIFESGPSVALALAAGGDDVGLLTRRIRAAAGPPARAGSGGRARSGTPGGVGARRRGGAREAARAHTLRRGRQLGDALRTALPSVRTLLPFVAVLTVVTVVTLGVLSWVGSRDDARAATPGGTRSGARSSAPPGPESADPGTAAAARAGPVGAARGVGAEGAAGAAGAAGSGEDVRLAADAPRRDPLALVQALADARAAAWSSGVAARLVEVDAARSPALARDTEVLAEVQRSRQRYVGLDFVAREARVVSSEGEVVTIRTRIDTQAHVVRGPSGEVKRPASSASPVLLDLVRTPSGWRVHDVRLA